MIMGQKNITIPEGKKIYFASDFHLGVKAKDSSQIREKKIVKWLDQIQKDAFEIYLVGDVFDFWFEYKTVVPKGFIRLQGKIAELTDKGIPVHMFTGNHDMWIFDYIPDELGVKLYRGPIEKVYNEKKFFIGHGDGLGPGDKGYKFIKKVFSNKLCQWLFARLHPNFGIGLANYWSGKSRSSSNLEEMEFLGEKKEWLVQFCKNKLEKEHFDYFVFGHRHLPLNIDLPRESKYINLGDWLHHYTFLVFDGKEVTLEKWED